MELGGYSGAQVYIAVGSYAEAVAEAAAGGSYGKTEV